MDCSEEYVRGKENATDHVVYRRSGATSDDGVTTEDFQLTDEERDEAKTIQHLVTKMWGVWSKDFMMRQIENWRELKINIGVTGRTGMGKSSLINRLIGRNDDDEGAAKVDVTECTDEPASYPHPDNSNLLFWDLPGLGTKLHKQEHYLEEINFESFDFFIIVLDEFAELDNWLANHIIKAKKQFLFVRAKVDLDIRNDKQRLGDNHNPATILRRIRETCEKEVKQKTDSAKVFLISTKHRNKYDFPKLIDHLVESFSTLKREAMALSLSAVSSPKALEQKRNSLHKQAVAASIGSAAAAAIPVPGLGTGVDFAIIGSQIALYKKQFGLTDSDLKSKARALKMDVKQLKALFNLRSMAIIGTFKALSALGLIGGTVVLSNIGQDVLAIVLPIVGSGMAGVLSFSTTLLLLRKIIDIMYSDALRLNHELSKRLNIDECYIDKTFTRKVAIMGEVGSGKSTLVNALLGLVAGQAAEVSVRTTKKKAYKRTTGTALDYCEIWDLPGIGLADLLQKKYLKEINYKNYDIYIICCTRSMKECDWYLVTEVLKLKKPTFLVRTHVEEDIHNSEPQNEEEVLEEIRDKYSTDVADTDLKNMWLYLIDTFYKDKFDFPSFLKELCFQAKIVRK